MGEFEDNLQKNFFSTQKEKTFTDKLLARDDVQRISELMKKEKLERKDLLELLYLCGGTEAKLLNFGEWDRYLQLKFFTWIRDFVHCAELMYDYQDYLLEQKKQGKIILTKRAEQLLKNNERIIEHITKFLIDLYLNIGRTTMSLGANAFLELLKNKFEIAYPQQSITNVEGKGQAAIWGGKKTGG